MTRHSGTASSKDWPGASSATSIVTAGRSWARRLRADGARAAGRRGVGGILLAVALLSTGASCAYLNTFYNAEQAYEEGERLASEGSAGDSLPAPAREAFRKAAEKSAIVLRRHGESKYADDALLLMGRSFHRLGRFADAAAAYERLIARFPESGLVDAARLGLARARRLAGDAPGAETALAPLVESRPDQAEILHERALIALAGGDNEAAVDRFRRLLERHPGYAREEDVALRFADAELAIGEVEAALEAYAAYRERASDPAARRRVGFKVARALALAGRPDDALEAYASLLEEGISDSLASVAHAERGHVMAARQDWDAAEVAFRRAAELAPGTPAASRATLGRGRIAWRVRGDRGEALEILLDAFLHAPTSAWGDSARTEARRVAELLHYERLAEGRESVPAIDDLALVRSTALYRLGEEVLDVERDTAAAAEIFERLAERYPDSPWRPKALLSAGLLNRSLGGVEAGASLLARLVEAHPDSPEADSARRVLELPVPERPGGFYGGAPVLVSLTRALPRPPDPMLAIVDQLDRYAGRRAAAAASSAGRDRGAGPDETVTASPEEEEDVGVRRPADLPGQLPPGAEP